jgi:signal transduction histidine kinase
LHLNALESDVSQFAKKNQEAFGRLKLILQTTTQEVKSISRDLMPTVLQDYGLVKALEFLCQTINEASPVALQLQVYRMDRELDQERKVGLYRVVQELVNNALKHARATRIDVQLLGHPTSVVLLVEDDGAGFAVPASDTPRTSYGLRNIETRIKSLGGTLAIDSRPGQGTTITVEIPTT